MKAEIVKTESVPEFKPVAFKITCETQEDLDFWSTLFSYTAMQDCAKKFGCAATNGGWIIPSGILLAKAGGRQDTQKMSAHFGK